MNLPPLERTVCTYLFIALYPPLFLSSYLTYFSPLHLISHRNPQPGNVKPGITPLPNSTMLQTYNTLLSTATSTFATTHPGTKSMLFDTYSFLTSILDNPAPYGITNTTSFCPRYDAPDIETNYAAYGCVPLEQYFWYNSGHITWRVHGFLAGAVRGFLESEGY